MRRPDGQGGGGRRVWCSPDDGSAGCSALAGRSMSRMPMREHRHSPATVPAERAQNMQRGPMFAHWTAPTDPVQVGLRYGSCYRPGDGMQCLSTRAYANPVARPPGWHQPVRRPEMHVIGEVAGQQIQGANAALVLIAIVIVALWRVLLRLLLALIAIAIVILVGTGAIMLLHR